MGGDYCVDYRGRAVRFDYVMEQFDIKPGCRVLMMDEAMIVGKCRNCKHYDRCDEFDPYDWQEDDCYICRMAVSVGGTNMPEQPKSDFGCVMWECK